MTERRKCTVTAEQFIRAWQDSETAQEVSERLEMPLQLMWSRASSYRKLGVRLKGLRRQSGKKLDLTMLNKVADEAMRAFEEKSRVSAKKVKAGDKR